MRQTSITSRLLPIFVSAVCCATVAGCADDSDGGGGRGGDGGSAIKIGFLGYAKANSFAQAAWAGIQAEAKKEGAKATFLDSNFDSQRQIAQIQNATVSKAYDALIVQANDSAALVPAVEDAVKAGIVVVSEWSPIGPRYDTAEPQVPGTIHVGIQLARNGEIYGGMAAEACEGIDPCKVIVLQGDPSLPLVEAETSAAREVLEAAEGIEVAMVESGYTFATGLRAGQNITQAHPDVDVVVGTTNAMLGVTRAIEEAGLTPGSGRGEVRIVGNGGSVQAIEAVQDGRWHSTYVIAERDHGAKAAELAIAAVRGEDVQESFDTWEEEMDFRGTRRSLSGYEGQYRD